MLYAPIAISARTTRSRRSHARTDWTPSASHARPALQGHTRPACAKPRWTTACARPARAARRGTIDLVAAPPLARASALRADLVTASSTPRGAALARRTGHALHAARVTGEIPCRTMCRSARPPRTPCVLLAQHARLVFTSTRPVICMETPNAGNA